MDDEQTLAVIAQLLQINEALSKLAASNSLLIARVEKYASDLETFAERFEEVVTQLEDERRLDLMSDYK